MKTKIGTLIGASLSGGESKILKNYDLDGLIPSINSQVETNNLYNSLLKGELTQEVIELRYSNYKILEESNNYKHIGNGSSIKVENTTNDNGKLLFKIYNKFDYASISSDLNDTTIENELKYKEQKLKSLFNIEYNYFPSVKIEEFINLIEGIKINENEIILSIYLNKPFYNCDLKLKKMNNEITRYSDNLNKCDFLDIKNIDFNYYDNLEYKKFKGDVLDIINHEITTNYIRIDYNCVIKSFEKGYMSDLFNDKQSEIKYKNKEKKKNSTLNLTKNF